MPTVSMNSNSGVDVLKPLDIQSSSLLSLSKPMDVIKQKKAAFVQVVEQPAGKGLRFRYECEGRSAGSIPGASSTQENRTFPTIRVVGYSGRAVVVVSCVTAESPYRPHPHNLVGKEGCKKGVCTLELGEDMSCSFPSLGIQCVKKKDIEESLSLRQQIRVDPYQTGFTHKTNPTAVDLNCVRLAFQVFLEGNDPGAFTFPLKPVVSDPIYDKKSKCDLTICRLTETSASVAGGKEILLFCDKITKDDIQVRFYEETDTGLVWEGFGEFQPADVHKQYGICFKTPKYQNIEIESSVKVKLQLRRPSDGAVSESRMFEFLPLDAGRNYWSAKRLKTNYTVFNQILTVDQALQAEELRHKAPLMPRPESQVLSTQDLGALIGNAPISATQTTMPTDIVKIEGQPGVRQQLKPVAMPGSLQAGSRLSQPTLMSAVPLIPATSTATTLDRTPPEVPVRSPMKSSLLQSGSPAVPNRQPRPMSDVSMFSDFTQCDAESVTTRQSVNEILSLADAPVCTDDSINLDNITIDYYFQDPSQVKTESTLSKSSAITSKPNVDYMGSMSSVTTVREIKAGSVQPADNSLAEISADGDASLTLTETAAVSEQQQLAAPNLAEDINQIYDDVMQCVYDDVDVKYDDLEMMDVSEPPVPPMRKRGLSVDRGVLAGLDKPLPDAPKNPSIITKLSEKKNELKKEREKENEKKRLIEEQKRKEREMVEEQKRKEKEEKERKKFEEKEKKKQEEEQRKQRKKHEEEERRLQKQSESDSEKLNQSLFQRLFQRNQSKLEEGNQSKPEDGENQSLETPPPVPAHGTGTTYPDVPAEAASASSFEPENLPSPVNLDTELENIEQLINQGGRDLQRLDSAVNEFTNQFPTDNNNTVEQMKLASLPSL